MKRPSSASGGSAAAAGMEFQHRVAAWLAVHILAEKGAEPLWGLPVGTTLEWLQCETEQSVDDLLLGTSAEGYIFAQIKQKVTRDKSTESDLASALDQFVRQFLAGGSKASGMRTAERSLDVTRDRLVLITSPRSSRPIQEQLRDILSRLRSDSLQVLDDAAKNSEERRTLSLVREHVTRSWRETTGADPTDEDLRELLSLVHVEVVDVEEGRGQEREALSLLRNAVLRDPDQAQLAWARLISLTASLAARRRGARRIDLQRALADAGVGVRAVRSYREDIERLRTYSATTLNMRADSAQIRLGFLTIRIQRPSTMALRRAAEENSILVVGEPGAGKSGTLCNLGEALEGEGREFIFLAVDRLSARSLGELRAEIGLEHELVEVLDNWPGQQPAFVIIDALDAARGEPAEGVIQDLIRQVIQKGGRWRIVASIRTFDLRYSGELKVLFSGSPPTEYQDPEFPGVRHFKIRGFSDEELSQVISRSAELGALVRNASEELKDLLRVPFYLRIMAELLGGGLSPDELTPIRTRLELLDKYWERRVWHGKHGGARDAVLREVCEKMVAARALRIDRSAVERAETSVVLDDLLSAQVLVEWQPLPEARPERYVLAFSHHVVFDYAVERLLLRGTPDQLIRRLGGDPDLTVFIRPSLVLHFYHLWRADSCHGQFWDLVFRVIRNDRLPEIAKLIGPSVGAEIALVVSDLKPLCAALNDMNSPDHVAAEQALRHLVGALLAGAPDRLVGPGAGPWSELLERLSGNLTPSLAYPVLSLLKTMCDRPEDFTPEQRAAAGQAARRLLEFSWTLDPRDSRLVIHSIRCVCRTFESDPSASAALIRRCLEPAHLVNYGYEEMPWLAREVKRLIALDQELVGEIYRAAFTFEETSEEPTPIGQSGILPLVSTRRQDYRMARYELAEAFPEFLEREPETAARTLVAVMEAYVDKHQRPATGEWQEETFDFEGRRARLLVDYSAIWDEGDTYRHDEPLKMLDAFQHYMEGLAGRESRVEQLRTLLHILAFENRLAVLWRRVLSLGARFPVIVGKVILPLAWATPILTAFDTTVPAGDFIRAVFPYLDHQERRRIEQAILGIPEAVPAEERDEAEHIRNRLLGCLTVEKLVTGEARRLIEELKRKNAIPANEPLVSFEFGTEAYDEERHLKDRGVPVDAGANRKIRELEGPVKGFADKHLNSVPTREEVNGVLPALRALHQALSRADDGVHPMQRDYAWGHLAAACACIARTDGISCAAEPGSFVKHVLLEASCHHQPAHRPEYDAQFDERPGWGSPAARLEAARGLVVLAGHAGCADSEVLRAIERLSCDPVPAVRFQIARYLQALWSTAPDLMWDVIERMSRREESRGVLQGLLAGPLRGLAGAEPDRVADLTKAIFDRVCEGPGAKAVRRFCMGIFAGLYIWRDHPFCREVVLEIASDPAPFVEEVTHILTSLGEAATHGSVTRPEPRADAVRQRALDLVERLLRSARRDVRDLEQRSRNVPFKQWPQQNQDKAKSLAQLIDRIGTHVYFTSGAHDSQRQSGSVAAQRPKPESERFYREATTILDELAEAALPSVTHHLVETLEFFIPIDPRGVFLRIGQVVRYGEQGGYQYESLAADCVVRLIERYLGDYRTLLREDAECRQTLIEILDVLIRAGWPNARRLVYRLEDIFR